MGGGGQASMSLLIRKKKKAHWTGNDTAQWCDQEKIRSGLSPPGDVGSSAQSTSGNNTCVQHTPLHHCRPPTMVWTAALLIAVVVAAAAHVRSGEDGSRISVLLESKNQIENQCCLSLCSRRLLLQ